MAHDKDEYMTRLTNLTVQDETYNPCIHTHEIQQSIPPHPKQSTADNFFKKAMAT